ncbi:hypothetical protein [Streptomyces sp. NPDC050564]|uniref:hypothetical protein n=1 Tax=Streptomyces sp. NPDC050564 TaxID=3365631 RepID=UPI0037A5A992
MPTSSRHRPAELRGCLGVGVVTVAMGRSYAIADHNDHPVTEGPVLLDRLVTAPERGTCEIAAEADIHIDRERRRVGW